MLRGPCKAARPSIITEADIPSFDILLLKGLSAGCRANRIIAQQLLFFPTYVTLMECQCLAEAVAVQCRSRIQRDVLCVQVKQVTK